MSESPRRSPGPDRIPVLLGAAVFAVCLAATLFLAHQQSTAGAASRMPALILVSGLLSSSGLAFLTERLFRHRGRLREAERRLASLAEVSNAIDRSPDVEALVVRVVRAVREAFGADRAWLVHPCDPDAPTYRVEYTATAPGWEIDPAHGKEFTPTPEGVQAMRELLATQEAVSHGVDRPLPGDPSRNERFRIQSLLSIALRPRAGKPWILGLHQCTSARHWTESDRLLLRDISLRLADALTQRSLLQDFRESEARFRALAESIGDVIWETGPDLRFRYVSPQCLAVFGRPPEDVVGKTPFDFMNDADGARAREVAGGIRDARASFTRRVRRVERPDGTATLVEMMGVFFFDD